MKFLRLMKYKNVHFHLSTTEVEAFLEFITVASFIDITYLIRALQGHYKNNAPKVFFSLVLQASC